MALVVNDRVKETSTTTGTGTFTLAGAVLGFETFSSAIGNTNTTYYTIVNENGEFEVGLGTVAAGTLARTTIISSSNSDSAVNFSSGTKDVFCTLPASKAVILDSSGNIVANNGSNLTNLNATNLASGTVPDARFPSTLPAANGSALTNLNATALTTGTVNNARLPNPISDKVINASTPLTVKGDGSSADGQLVLNCSQNSHGVKIKSPAHAANATWEWILPVDDGTSGQVLTTDGNASAQLSWTTPEVGDITGVTAGTNLTGGGSSGDVTINLADASTSAKGAASFSSDNFAASSGAITIKDLGVATAEIQDDAITLAKMAPGTDGNLITYDTSGNPAAVATGSAGQVLTSAGAGAVPTFQTPTVGDITAVTAGSGLTGGGTTGDVTLNVGAGNLIDVTADAIDVDLSELTTSTSDADGDFFAVVDSANAQKKLTKGNIAISGFNNDSGFIDGSALNASNLNSGTVPDARFPATLPALNGSALTALNASNLGSGTVPTARLGTGTASSSTFLAGDQTYKSIAAAAITSTANGANNRLATYTGADGLNGEANLTFDGSTLTVTGAVVPGANDTYDLGASGNVWRNLYTGDLHLSNEAKTEGNKVDGTKGNWTIQEGSEDLYIFNNKSGKKYKFKLEEI